MTRAYLFILLGCCGLSLWLCGGCSYTVTYGHFVPNSQFAYPNSNIKPLGPVRAEIKKKVFEGSPSLSIEEIKKCYNDALSQASGANLLINYREDTTLTHTTVPYVGTFTEVKYVLEGEAAQQTIGQKHLK
ncbi:MAG: hypothetical protein WC975_15075 [Phycisphaerae bacterium]